MAVPIKVSESRVAVTLFARRQSIQQQDVFEFTKDALSETLEQSPSAATGYLLKNQPTRYAVGIVGADGKLRLMQADLFSMDAANSAKRKLQSVAEAPESSRTFFEARQELIDTYAPAKKQRQVRQAINAQVKDERIEGKLSAIEGLKAAAAAAEAAVGQGESGMLLMMRETLPEFDLETSEVSRIYNFGSVFSDSLIATLSLEEGSPVSQVLQWLKDGCPETAEIPEITLIRELHVFNRLGNIFVQSKHMKSKTFARLFVVCVGMVLYFKNRKNKTGKSPEQCLVSEQIYNTFVNLYGGGRIANDMSDKLLCHIVCFILKLTPDFAFSFGLLVQDLKDSGLTHKQLQPVLEFVGCTVKSGVALNATLVAPLKIPQVFANRKRRS